MRTSRLLLWAIILVNSAQVELAHAQVVLLASAVGNGGIVSSEPSGTVGRRHRGTIGLSITGTAGSADGRTIVSGFWSSVLAGVATDNQSGDQPGIPIRFALEQSYPNPFNPTTTIRFDVPHLSRVRLTVYDVLGRSVATLVDGQLAAGNHETIFDGSGLVSGTYFYILRAGDFSETRSLVLVK